MVLVFMVESLLEESEEKRYDNGRLQGLPKDHKEDRDREKIHGHIAGAR